MPQRGVNRITMAVWDIEQGRAFYEKLLGATFESVHDEDAEKFGVQCLIAWDAGIELLAPLEGRDSHVRQVLETRGEGIVGAVLAVEDVDASQRAATELGVRTTAELDYDASTIDRWLQGRFTKYKEYFLGSDAPLGPNIVIGEFVGAGEKPEG